MNLEVVKRAFPCRWYADPKSTKCRSCQMLVHVRPVGTDRTYCGHLCSTQEDWIPMPGTHPEDIPALDRCLLCYKRLPERETIL